MVAGPCSHGPPAILFGRVGERVVLGFDHTLTVVKYTSTFCTGGRERERERESIKFDTFHYLIK